MNESDRPYPATLVLVGLNILIFALESFAGGSQNMAVALRFGALSADRALSGEWWRLFTSMFIHFGSSHLISNMVTLLLFGSAVERLLGWWRMVVIYLVSGLAGNVLWLLLQLRSQEQVVSAGASGAIFGLVGVYVAMALIPEMRRFVSVRNVIIMLILNFAYGTTGMNINLAAHAGGLIAGTILGCIFLRRAVAARRTYRR